MNTGSGFKSNNVIVHLFNLNYQRFILFYHAIIKTLI